MLRLLIIIQFIFFGHVLDAQTLSMKQFNKWCSIHNGYLHVDSSCKFKLDQKLNVYKNIWNKHKPRYQYILNDSNKIIIKIEKKGVKLDSFFYLYNKEEKHKHYERGRLLKVRLVKESFDSIWFYDKKGYLSSKKLNNKIYNYYLYDDYGARRILPHNFLSEQVLYKDKQGSSKYSEIVYICGYMAGYNLWEIEVHDSILGKNGDPVGYILYKQDGSYSHTIIIDPIYRNGLNRDEKKRFLEEVLVANVLMTTGKTIKAEDLIRYLISANAGIIIPPLK